MDCTVAQIVCGIKILGYWDTPDTPHTSDTSDTSAQNVTFREPMCIKIVTEMFQYDTAVQTDVFRTGDTAHKQNLTPHTGYDCLYAVLPY
jgi:predicted double-glycine peptidase